jgi:hypothetical protein
MVRIVEIMRKRFSDVFRVMAAIRKAHHPRHDYKGILAEIISEVLAPHVEMLNWPAEKSAQVIRLVTFAASLKPFSTGMDFDSREISAILLYGLVGKPAIPTSDSTESQA